MGLTGSGKSTLISRLTGEDVGIGHSLHSCMKFIFPAFFIHFAIAYTTKFTGTIDVTGYAIQGSQGEKIYLIDTPGFDDT